MEAVNQKALFTSHVEIKRIENTAPLSKPNPAH